MNIETPRGTVQIIEATLGLLRSIRDLMPFGALQFSEPQNGARYGLVMQCEEGEVFCIKQQPVELDRQGAEEWMQIQHWMIAEAYCRYIKHGFSGAYLAAPYLRQRDNELWEPGVAHFVFPSPKGIESQEFPFEDAFDHPFGHGATTMFTTLRGTSWPRSRSHPSSHPTTSDWTCARVPISKASACISW